MQPIFGAMGRPILAGFFGDPSDYCGGGLYYIQKTYGPPKNFIYGIAVAPYFGDDPTEFTGTGWNVQGVISAMNVANQYGVKLCGYEGGAGLTQTPESAYDTSVAEEQTPQMAACYVDFANMWQSQGGDLCNFFTNTGVDSQYGLYGHLPIISLVDDLSNPFCTKYNAAASLNSSLGCNCGNAEPPPPPPQPAPPPPTPPPAPAPSPAPSSANKSSGSTGSSTSSSSANTSMKGIKYLGNNRWWSPIYGYFSTSPINGPRH